MHTTWSALPGLSKHVTVRSVRHWRCVLPPRRVRYLQSQHSLRANEHVEGVEHDYVSSGEHSGASINLRRAPGVPLLQVSSTKLDDFILPTAQHRSLSSFLDYARQNAVSRTSAVYTGTLYEYVILQKLLTFGFDLVRVGGAGDAGIDLLGYWHLPMRQEPLKVLVQCKRLSKSGQVKPSMIRELEAVFGGAPVQWRAEDTIGVLVGTKSATKGIRDAMGRSRRPFVWIMAEELNDRTEANAAEQQDNEGDEPGLTIPQTVVRQILWNQSAATLGFEGLNVVPRYQTMSNSGQSSEETPSSNHTEVGLMWKERFVPALDGG